MGFSVSGATAVLFVAALVSFGMLYTATANGVERVTDAEAAGDERLLDQRNTDVALDTTSYDSGSGTLTVAVNNTGGTTLSVGDTDLIVDNAYADRTTRVDGNSETDLWLPGETLTFEASVAAQPSRVKVVTGAGVAVTEGL
jgi:flagellar protein FlaF